MTMKSGWFISHSFNVHYAVMFVDNNIFNNTTIRGNVWLIFWTHTFYVFIFQIHKTQKGNIIIYSLLYWKHNSHPICHWIYSSTFFMWMQGEISWFQGTIPIYAPVFSTFRLVPAFDRREKLPLFRFDDIDSHCSDSLPIFIDEK